MPEQSNAGQYAIGSNIAQADHGSTAIVVSYNYAPPRPVDATTLEAARRRLAELPLEEVPKNPVALPPGSRMDLKPNRCFVGRQERLKDLAKILKGGDDATSEGQVVAVVLSGMGGVGKSQLASEFVHRYGQYFSGGVFWLSFAEPSAIRTEVAACGGAGGAELGSDFVALSIPERAIRVMSAWKSPLPRLLVFDNCEEEGLLDQWRPPTGGCRVLVTSRREAWDPSLGAEVLPLDVLSRKESIALLRKYRPDLPEDDVDLDAIAGELGDLALAVDLAGRYLAKYRFEVTQGEYLTQLQSPELFKHPSLQKVKGVSPTDHEMDVYRTLALSYERLDTADPTDSLAVAVLARAACFAPGEAIPRRLLLLSLDLPEGDPAAKRRAADAISRLAELGLLWEQESGSLTLHRLLAAFVRTVVDDAEAKPAVEQALLETAADLLDKGYPEPLVALLPHLRAVTDAAKEREDERAASLCTQLGSCLDMTGAYAEARPLYERALAINEKLWGEDHPNTALSLNNLAGLLSAQGSYEEARPLYERALTIREKVLGEEDPNTASSLNNLAYLLYEQGKYQEARPLYERALAINEKVLGEEHPRTITSLNNLAALLSDQGSYQEARPLHERALAINEKLWGEDHPLTATSLNNLAGLLHAQGSYEEARPLYERALAINEKVLGEEYPNTASILNNLAALLYEQGKYQEARPLYERALAISEKLWGEDHPNTALSLNNLALLLHAQGSYQEARPLYERALAINEKLWGEEHPLSKGIRQNLTTLDTQQRVTSIIGFFRRLITRKRR